MPTNKMYSYRNSLKSDKSDELINRYLTRPIAGLIVLVIYYTPITPNQVTIASTFAGFLAAFFYLKGTQESFVAAGLLVLLKDLLDSADGQLARAKRQYSRVGRFLDSISDFVVNVVVFGAIGLTLFQSSGSGWMLILVFAGLVGITLRVSYHVFYQVNFLHLENRYLNNRVTEEIRKEDIQNGGIELILQRIFQVTYGWQDRMMMRLDSWSLGNRTDTNLLRLWYSDTTGICLSGFLGLGTEIFLLMLCSVFNRVEVYLYLNLFLMNGILITCVLYRRVVLLRRLIHGK